MWLSSAGSEGGKLSDRTGSRKKTSRRISRLGAAQQTTYVWSELHGGHWRAAHRGGTLLVWIQPVWVQDLLLLSLLLLTVAHIEEHGDGENREWNNGADNTCWISKVRSSYHLKSRFRDVPPTIAPVFGPLLELSSLLLEPSVGSDWSPVEVLVSV